MSIKKEYDLDYLHQNTIVVKENPFKIEKDEQSTDIDIKLEFPYQSVQFPVELQDDHPHQMDNLEEMKDPLELDDISNTSDSNPEHATTTKPSTVRKLKKISTAICTKCNLGFPSPFLFEQHMINIHQDERPYPCKHCGKPFATVPQQKLHETIHDPKRFQGEPQFSCDLCSKSYHLKSTLQGHKLKFHTGYKQPKRPKSTPVREHHSTSGVKNPNAHRTPKEIHSCPYCDLTFDMNYTLQRHLIVHTKQRPFSCPICQHSFPRKATLTRHIKNIHNSATTTPTGKTQSRPHFQAKEPCSSCKICRKKYPIPSQLSRHMRLHTAGEKPFSCLFCTNKFRTKGALNSHTSQIHVKEQLRSNPLKLFRCRICGRNDFVLFNALKRHRLGTHRNIPYETEKEKPFSCGICGKPYFLREGALICAMLGHDASKLRKIMFKVRCPECPPGEIYGHYNVLGLRRHWRREHGDKIIPARFRKGMNGDKELIDELPNCTVDKVKKEDIRVNGVDIEQVKREGLMYIELDLLEIPEEDRFFKRRKLKDDNPKRKEGYGLFSGECKICGKKFRRVRTLRKHELIVHLNKFGRRKVGRQKKKLRKGGKRGMELRKDIGIGLRSVNIKDTNGVQAILNFQTVQVRITKDTL